MKKYYKSIGNIIIAGALFAGVQNAVFSQDKQFGDPGANEISGSLTSLLSYYNQDSYTSLTLNLDYDHYFWKNVYLGGGFRFYFTKLFDPYAVNFYDWSLNAGVLLPIKENLFFNAGARFDFDWYEYSGFSFFDVTPVLVTGLKQVIGKVIINYELQQSFIGYYAYNSIAGWSDPYYRLNVLVGFSVYY